MELMELYDKINNPIDDLSVIEKLINAYANSSKGLGGYYRQLTKTAQKEHNKGQYYPYDADKFYSMLFNKWKNSIVAMTREEFIELYKRGSYGQDFIKMREYLKNISDVSTMKEANEILYGKKGDKELEDALEKYDWQSLGIGSGWVHVCSKYLTAKKDQFPNVEHRLYLNTESLDTYKMTTYLVEKCDEHKLPYYFKFDKYADRDDTIVIYSSTENLMKYIEILQEIKKEHPDLVSKFKEPPVLTGKIDGWIGYGSEPAKTPDGKNHSFNKVRSKILEETIGKVTKKWIMNHRNQQITYHGQTMSFQDYIAVKSTKKLLADLERRYSNYGQDDIETINRLGYSLQDLKSPQNKQNIFNVLRDRMGTLLTKVCNGTYEVTDEIVMKVRNGNQIKFRGYDLEDIIKELSVNISKGDPNFISSIQAEIKNNARQYGIDSNNFCFDIKARERIKTVAAQKEEQEQQIQQKNTTKVTNSIEMDSLDVQTLPQIINPTLMERRMKLPNGAEISAKQYIQEVVYPQLPKNGVVILDNGSILSVKQFIEECVMVECQEKYDGDFPRYIAERTRSNSGVVSIEYGDEKIEIDPVEITNYINPILLEKRIKLPNGTDISASQYIQDVYASHIPANGRVILSNGIEMPAIQYIEEKLLWEDQEKYNGDISQILYHETINNIGTINADPQQFQQTLIEMRNQASITQHSNDKHL